MYSEQEIQEHAKKFTSRIEWQRACNAALAGQGTASHYNAAYRKGPAFFHACCEHMQHLKAILTDEEIIASAAQYQHKVDWKTAEPLVYNTARSRRSEELYNRATAHMKPKAHPFSGAYIVYAYEFCRPQEAAGTVYVGLTMRPEQRAAEHALRGPVFDFKAAAESVPGCTCGYLVPAKDLPTPDAAQEAEARVLADYKARGWTLLNAMRAGSLGTVRPAWDYERVLVEAQKFTSRSEWSAKSQGSYLAAQRNGWIDEAAAHMKRPVRDRNIGKGLKRSPEARQRMSEAARRRGLAL